VQCYIADLQSSPCMSTDNARPAVVDSLLHSFQASESPVQPTATTKTASAVSVPNTHHVGGPPFGQAQARMRSSIACVRCRRSKVKCVNIGIGSPCRSCENSGRECTYPPPMVTGTKRRDSLSGKADGEPERKRPRKSNSNFVPSHTSGAGESTRSLLDALDSRLLTPQVWLELFEIFQIHYSADLPFLHPPTFQKPLKQAHFQPQPLTAPNEAQPTPRPPACSEFLLAFLALTARFHTKLVAYHSPPTSQRASNPLIASEYYAAAASERLAHSWTENVSLDIERIQASLMLGLHEWGMCRGAKAWLTIGNAIRQAQAMGLQYEMDLDDEPLSRSLALNWEAERMGVNARKSPATDGRDEADAFIQQEIRRRTFWSCFIMDRYLSSGKYRPQMLHAKELRIQLPASERSFVFAEKVRTLMLGHEDDNGPTRADVETYRSTVLGGNSSPDRRVSMSPRLTAQQQADRDGIRLETGPEEGLISRYVKILEIYGSVVKYSCAGGRRYVFVDSCDSTTC
jgi:ribosomal protein L37AE/L43A